ncbi:hypothetical protein MW887_005646 [Aspergillus wentii]|nr:hypothetical protein MW887_005646 [Aspergillus wentii]
MKLFLSLFALFGSLAFAEDEIIKGTESPIQKFPWQVSIQSSVAKQHICGGSILSGKYILTAAHCMNPLEDPSLFSVRAGSSDSDSGGQEIKVKRFTRHPDYQKDSPHNNDVAIIELESGFQFVSDIVYPVKLADAADGLPAEGTAAVVSGWGFESLTKPPPSQLQSVNVAVTNRTKCEDAWANQFPPEKISPNMVCAVNAETGGGSCFGDSGGPLVDSKTNKQIGIVSFGKLTCASEDKKEVPDIYTSVSAVRDFINNNAVLIKF